MKPCYVAKCQSRDHRHYIGRKWAQKGQARTYTISPITFELEDARVRAKSAPPLLTEKLAEAAAAA
jgi:hypothetical protein